MSGYFIDYDYGYRLGGKCIYHLFQKDEQIVTLLGINYEDDMCIIEDESGVAIDSLINYNSDKWELISSKGKKGLFCSKSFLIPIKEDEKVNIKAKEEVTQPIYLVVELKNMEAKAIRMTLPKDESERMTYLKEFQEAYNNALEDEVIIIPSHIDNPYCNVVIKKDISHMYVRVY